MATQTLHLTLPWQHDMVVHAWPSGDHTAHACHTPRGAGICACGTFRLCDPARTRCAQDCPCACHQGREAAWAHGGRDAQ